MRAAADTACSSNRKSSKSDSLNNQGLLFILFSPTPMCLLLLLVFNDVAGVNRRKTLHRHGMVVSAHGPPS